MRMLDQDADHVQIPVTTHGRDAGQSTTRDMQNLCVTHMLMDPSSRRIGRLLYGRRR